MQDTRIEGQRPAKAIDVRSGAVLLKIPFYELKTDVLIFETARGRLARPGCERR
jgi:hypothetical protein